MTSERNLEKAGADLRASASSMPYPQIRARKPVRRGLIAFATGLAVALIIGIPSYLTRTSSPDVLPVGAPADSTTTTAPATTTSVLASSTTVATPLACGGELPYQVTLPEDFNGPNMGPSPHAPDPAEEGQLIVHWLGRDGSVEIRWPANAEYMEGAVWGDTAAEGARPAPEDDWPLFIGPEFPDVDGVDRPIVGTILPTAVMSGPCDASQLAIYSPNGEGVESDLVAATFGTSGQEGLVIFPELARPRDKALVVETIETDTIPEVVACDGGPGVDFVPKKSGTTPDSPVFASPEEALQDILGTDIAGTWPKVGYFELVSPDGTITYGNPYDDNSADPRPENGLVISVTVVEGESGWSVTKWETSGC